MSAAPEVLVESVECPGSQNLVQQNFLHLLMEAGILENLSRRNINMSPWFDLVYT